MQRTSPRIKTCFLSLERFALPQLSSSGFSWDTYAGTGGIVLEDFKPFAFAASQPTILFVQFGNGADNCKKRDDNS